MKPWLCAAGVQLRDQIDTWYPDRRACTAYSRADYGSRDDARGAVGKKLKQLYCRSLTST